MNELLAPGGLRPGKLPKVVDDAIIVCEQLRQRFLWVDRYCIQQDSHGHEKQVQINSMGDIFSSAEFTIIHANGTHINDPIPGVSTTRKVLQTTASVCGLDLVSGYPDMGDLVKKSTWNRRAWTYQESVLCPRRLIFTSYEVWLDCDDEARGDRMWREHFPQSTIETMSGNGLLGHRLENQFDDSYVRFCYHLEKYTARSLTQESDALNAFTGILSALYGEPGIYGLPEADFDRAVLWYNEEIALTYASGKERFPSWSWASTNSVVKTWARPNHLRERLVHWTYKSSNGVLNAVNSNNITENRFGPYRYGQHKLGPYSRLNSVTCLLVAWWKGCVEGPVPNHVKHAPPSLVCGRREAVECVQSCWVERLSKHLERDERCQECESYVTQRWPSLDHLWTEIRESAELEKTGSHNHSASSGMFDRSITDSLPPGVLLTRAQTARFRVGRRDNYLSDSLHFLDAEGKNIGDVLPTHPVQPTSSRYTNVVECMGVSLASNEVSTPSSQRWVEHVVVNVLIIDRPEGYLCARRIGVGRIELWDWAKADREFKDVILE